MSVYKACSAMDYISNKHNTEPVNMSNYHFGTFIENKEGNISVVFVRAQPETANNRQEH